MSVTQVKTDDIPEALIVQMQNRIGRLQMLNDVAHEAFALASDPECDPEQLSKVVQQDMKLSTFILKMANSSLFAPPHPISSLRRAILVTGQLRVRDYILSASLQALHDQMPEALQGRLTVLQQHAILTALMASRLSRLLRIDIDGEEEFTAGLIHDLGRTLLTISDPVNARHVDPLDFSRDHQCESVELKMYGATHSTVGSWFAQQNKLPENLVVVIRHHHAPQAATSHQLLVALVAAADNAANFLQSPQSHLNYEPESNCAISLLESLGVREACSRFHDHAQSLLEEVKVLARTYLPPV